MLSEKQKYQAPSGQSPLLCLAAGARGYERWPAGMRDLGRGRTEGEVLWGSAELARVAIWGFLHFTPSGWEWNLNMENGVQKAPRMGAAARISVRGTGDRGMGRGKATSLSAHSAQRTRVQLLCPGGPPATRVWPLAKLFPPSETGVLWFVTPGSCT